MCRQKFENLVFATVSGSLFVGDLFRPRKANTFPHLIDRRHYNRAKKSVDGGCLRHMSSSGPLPADVDDDAINTS